MLRAIREIQPSWVVGENVRGLTNWNGGVVFDEVQADMETEGYEVTPFLLPACAVNAPHRRDRIWFVAYNNSSTTGSPRKSGSVEINRSKNNDEQKQRGEQTELNTGSHELLRDASNTEGSSIEGHVSSGWQRFPTQSPVCNGDDGLSSRLDGITFPKWRSESIKAGGNAIVPQVAHQIFKAIDRL